MRRAHTSGSGPAARHQKTRWYQEASRARRPSRRQHGAPCGRRWARPSSGDISRCSASSGPAFGWIRLSWDLPTRSRHRELPATYFGSATSQFTGAPTWTVVGGPTSSKGDKADCNGMRAYDAAESVPRHDLDRICKSEARRSRVGSSTEFCARARQARRSKISGARNSRLGQRTSLHPA